jgi:hypothetical protein
MSARQRHWATLPSLVLLAGFAADAAADAPSKCDKLRFLAAGPAVRLQMACAGAAAAAGTTVDPACLAIAAERLGRKWERAGARGDCTTAVDTSTAQTIVDGFTAALDQALHPPILQNCCDTGALCFAGPSIDAPGCELELSGTLGLPGTVCDGATGDCVAPPATGGPCCSLTSLTLCSAGPSLNAQDCVLAGGLDYPAGVCEPSGSCALP